MFFFNVLFNNYDNNRKERNRLYINLFPGPREDVASAYSLFQGRKTGWVGEKRKIG